MGCTALTDLAESSIEVLNGSVLASLRDLQDVGEPDIVADVGDLFIEQATGAKEMKEMKFVSILIGLALMLSLVVSSAYPISKTLGPYSCPSTGRDVCTAPSQEETKKKGWWIFRW
ncbi:Uncharacterised protein [uncultured archaeon]|nr:Uncharacterised protein [uncultured archaeon]